MFGAEPQVWGEDDSDPVFLVEKKRFVYGLLMVLKCNAPKDFLIQRKHL
jgi:hypothetical protein